MNGLVFDVKVVVNDALNSLKSQMTEIKDVDFIICCILIEPQFESANLKLFP